MATINNKHIRIGIDGGEFSPQSGVKSGIQRLLNGFLQGLSPSALENKKLYFYGFWPAGTAFGNHSMVERRLPKRLFSSLFLPFSLLADRIKIFLGFSGVIPPFTRLFGNKSIVFIHDFAFLDHPENYGNPEKMKWQTEYALYGADRIVVFSDYIREQVHTRYPAIPREKTVRIYPGGDHLPGIPTSSATGKKQYFLYVGVIKPAKNILVLLSRFEKFIRFYHLDEVKLILVGEQEQEYLRTVQKTVVYHKLKERIEFKTGIDDGELSRLYHGCLGVLNVSHDEGFCYPVIEALEAGRPVIVNDIPLYQEFLPFYPALHITKSEDEFIEKMKTVMAPDTRQKTGIKSPFKWYKFSKELLAVAQELCI